MNHHYRAYINIDLDAIRSNVTNVRKNISSGTKIMGVIKADGYGHGAIPLAKEMSDMVEYFGVASIEEAILLRNAGIKHPILILGFTSKYHFKEIIEHQLTQTIYDLEMAKELSTTAVALNATVLVHIKIDTGMTRLGFLDQKDNINIIKEIKKMPGIHIEGIFSHFATSDIKDKTFTEKQLIRFLSFNEKLEKESIYIPIKHISNSAGVFNIPRANLDMVRLGIAAYGLYPSDEVTHDIKLTPALELKSYIVQTKKVDKDVGVGYGSTYVTTNPTKIAVVSIGYADGYPRALSSIGKILIHGELAPVIGRVCMDQLMIDITHIKKEVRPTDQVTLIGNEANNSITVEDICELTKGFHYELVCNLNKRLPRVYYKNHKIVEVIDYF